MMPHAEAVYIFDLDGTLLTVNSFPLWTRYLLGGGSACAPPRVRAGVMLLTALAVAERKLARRAHGLFKQRLQRIWARTQTEQSGEEFAGTLQPYLSPQFDTLMGLVKEERIDALLATAAAEEYAAPLAARLGFEHYVATPRGRAVEAENVGAAKRESVLAFVKRAGWESRPLVVFTDHLEDLPVIDIADRLIWCGDAEDAETIGRTRPSLSMLQLHRSRPADIADFAMAHQHE